MAIVGYKKISSQGSSHSFCLALDAWSDGSTAYCNLIMYTTATYVPYYQWRHHVYLSINGVQIENKTGQYPSASSQWWATDITIGGTRYRKGYTAARGSTGVGAAGGNIGVYGQYSVTGTANYLPSKGTHEVSGTVYVAPSSVWNDINAWNPAVDTQRGLMFDLATSDGGRWYNLTNEPSDMSRPYGTTATISNIRSNVTGAHYSYNSITNTAASSFSWTINTANFAVNLYTAWNVYSVGYNANGGTSTPSSVNVTHGNSTTLTSAISRNNSSSNSNVTISVGYNANGGSSTPSNSTGTAVNTTTTKYTFNKWAQGSTSGTQYAAGASFSPTANTTFYATWSSSSSTARTSNPSITLANAISRNNTTVSSYTVSYNANSGSSTPSTQTATKTRSYSFGGWNTNSSGTGTNYSAGSSHTFSANTTLYAKWSSSDSGGTITLPSAISRSNSYVSGYNISYNANGGSGAPSSQTSGSRKVTYTFNKWAEGSATGTKYSAGASYTPSSNTTMYATWTSSTTSSSSWTCSSTIPTRTGYTFLGWSTSSTATSPDYIAGQNYTITSGKTLYAVWKINNYYLDLSGYCDGASIGNISDFGKCDVYINGSLDATQVTDYYKAWPYGTSYEFKNITPDWGVKYNGIYSGSTSGTIGAANVTTRLSFTRLPVTLNANVNDNWETGIVWINVNGTWKKARALYINKDEEWNRLEKIDYTV